jgi:transcriptional regulator GlxA family with amidase domain
MKNIYILIYEDVILSSAAGPLDILTRTNDILIASGQSPAFNVNLVSEKKENIQLNNFTQFICQLTLDAVPENSSGHNLPLIVVPAFSGDWETVLNKNRIAIEWLKHHYTLGTEIASLCVGSYFLAQAGLLNGKTCTSHWKALADIQQRFPDIHVQGDFVVTDHKGTYTGGGAFSSLNLILYLVEKFCGHEIGVRVSKQFSIHRDHINQAHFSVFKGLNQHGDKEILKAQSYIEQNFRDELTVDLVVLQVNMSKRNFIRRFKQATQLTPLEYIQKIKIEAAKRQLENSSEHIQHVMYNVGYNDLKTFRDVFKRIAGVTPKEYRQKYGHKTSI